MSDSHEHNSVKTTPLGEENKTLTRMRGVTTRCYNGPDKTLVLADIVASDCWTHDNDMEAGPRWLVQGRRWNCEALVLVFRGRKKQSFGPEPTISSCTPSFHLSYTFRIYWALSYFAVRTPVIITPHPLMFCLLLDLLVAPYFSLCMPHNILLTTSCLLLSFTCIGLTFCWAVFYFGPLF